MDELREQLDRAHALGLVTVCYKEERRLALPHALLLAIASRETGCRDVVGDAGHGRGVFQIDDRFHHDWLDTWGAGEPGAVPPLRAAARLASLLLAQGHATAHERGLEGDDATRFAAAAYNAGLFGALDGLEHGDPDLRTTGRDYGRDVVRRMYAFRKLQAPNKPFTPRP